MRGVWPAHAHEKKSQTNMQSEVLHAAISNETEGECTMRITLNERTSSELLQIMQILNTQSVTHTLNKVVTKMLQQLTVHPMSEENYVKCSATETK